MFDEAEIRFLQRAVDLRLLTPNQRERMLGYQGQLPPNMTATTLVVEAGLMIEEEVNEVLASIASGVSVQTQIPTPAIDNIDEVDVGAAATRDTLFDIIGEDPHAEQDDDTVAAKAIAAAIRNVMHEGDPPLDASYNTVRENQEAAAAQKFPLPGQGGGSEPNAAPHVQDPALLHQEEAGDMAEPYPQEYAEHEMVEHTEEEIPESPLKQFAMSANEIDDILGEPAEQNEA